MARTRDAVHAKLLEQRSQCDERQVGHGAALVRLVDCVTALRCVALLRSFHSVVANVTLRSRAELRRVQ